MGDSISAEAGGTRHRMGVALHGIVSCSARDSSWFARTWHWHQAEQPAEDPTGCLFPRDGLGWDWAGMKPDRPSSKLNSLLWWWPIQRSNMGRLFFLEGYVILGSDDMGIEWFFFKYPILWAEGMSMILTWHMCRHMTWELLTPGHPLAHYPKLYTRRKFRNQPSDNMDRWKSRGGKTQRREEKKQEDQRRERVRRKKMQVCQKVDKSRITVFLQWFVAPEGRKVGSLN